MVEVRSFLIDATFVLDDAEKAFLGSTPIVDLRGRNTSVVYAAVRDILRLRESLGIVQGNVVIGADADDVSSVTNIEMFRDCLRAIGTSTLHEPKIRVGALCRSILHDRKDRWIITRNKSLMQLVTSVCSVILISDGTVPDVLTEDTFASRLCIRPDQVPSLLALTDATIAEPLTTKQAVRLLEMCGTLSAAFKSSSADATSPRTRRFLSANKDALLERLRNLTIAHHVGRPLVVPVGTLVRDDASSRQTLTEFGFPSLGRLLAAPKRVELVAAAQDSKAAYVAVVDRAGLSELNKAVANADVCALDTESTDKDPRKATLLGVALAVREGQAFYVPVTATDLRDISTEAVYDVLRTFLAKRMKIVGHNLKYDYVLLRRHEIQIGRPYFDTMLAAHECFGDWDFFNLGAVAKRLLGKEVKRYRDIVREGETLQDVPFRDMVEHGCADVDATLRLYGRLRPLLEEKCISDQFAKEVMPLMQLLGDKECDGIRVDLLSLQRKRDTLEREAQAKKKLIASMAGKQFDLDSMKEIATVFRGIDAIRERIGRQGLRQSQLEQLAQGSDLAREIVEYGRVQKEVRQLDAICKSAKKGKIFPLFSQVKAAHGTISSADPRIIDPLGAVPTEALLDEAIRQMMPNEGRALDVLQALSKDLALQSDRRTGKTRFIGGEKSSIVGLSHSTVLISLAIGVSNANLCKQFLIDSRRASAIREQVTARYATLFAWLDSYRKTVISAGFASSGTRRKYWDGLRSSDLDKRNRAVRSAVRWLIGM